MIEKIIIISMLCMSVFSSISCNILPLKLKYTTTAKEEMMKKILAEVQEEELNQIYQDGTYRLGVFLTEQPDQQLEEQKLHTNAY